MGSKFQLAMAKVVGLLALCLVGIYASEVQELGDPTRSDADAAEAGAATGTRVLNMPGPAYGKPGYKESHNWESDVDIYSPVVFNMNYYAAKYDMQGKSEAELKASWKSAGLNNELSAPDCRQATADFSLNTYAEKNPAVAEATEGKCAKLLENYLGQGLYDGLSGATSNKVLYCQEGQACKGDFAVQKAEEEGKDLTNGKDKWTPTQEYTLTFWLKLSDAMAVDSNILHYGDAEYQRSPAVYVKAGTTNLKVSVTQSNEQDFHCSVDGDEEPGALQKKTWYHVAIVVNNNGAKVYLNGEKKSECSNPDGITVVQPEGTHLYLSDPWSEPARAELQGLTYYPRAQMSEKEIMAQSQIEKASLK